MKKTIRLGLLSMILFATFCSPLLAQNTEKEMLSFTKKYEEAYNKKDDKALKALYTKDATRKNVDGSVSVGNEAIGDALATEFKDLDETTRLTITPDKAETEADGSLNATGSFSVKGKSKQTGEAFDVKGTYTNTMVKEGEKWKISKSILTAM